VRPVLRADNLMERIAFRLNLAPVPPAEVLTYPAAARSVMAGVRLGLFAQLAQATAPELAHTLELTPNGTRLLLDSQLVVTPQ
jgi:hypothetical protein